MDSRTADWERWLVPLAVTIGLIVVAVGTLVTVTTLKDPIHSGPDAVSSAMDTAPTPAWTAAAEQARQHARAAAARQNVPGLSVAVGVGGELVWAEGFGFADLEARTPVNPRTRFRIGHVSKALTSVGVGVLREEGRLHLDEEIQTYVPAFPRKEWPVSLRQLMAHTAGVVHYRDTEWGDKPKVHCDEATEGLTGFAAVPLLFEPGTEYRYSTYGWVLVSAAVEAASDTTFFQFMRDRVFAPAGMVDTEEEVVSPAQPDRATSYYRHLGSEHTTPVDYSCFAGAGAFISTPSDLVRFASALTRGGLLQASTRSLLQSPQSLRSGESTNYGLGWMLETVDLSGKPTAVIGHASRTIEGASTSFLIFPEHELVVAVSANLSFADMRSVALGIAQVFIGVG